MDKEKNLLEKIIMKSEKEILELIKQFEEEKGYGVHIDMRVYISSDTENIDGIVPNLKICFGDLSKRKINVERVEDLNPKYENDIKLILGKYNSITELKEKVRKLRFLYWRLDYGLKDYEKEYSNKIINMFVKEFNIGKESDKHNNEMLVLNEKKCYRTGLPWIGESNSNTIDSIINYFDLKEKTHKLLKSREIDFLRQSIKVDSNNLFDDSEVKIMGQGPFHYTSEGEPIKLARISYDLL